MDHASPSLTYPQSLYFVWDFVHRTRYNTTLIDPSALDANHTSARAQFVDVLGRCHLARIMVLDRTGEVMRGMTMGGTVVDFGGLARSRAGLLEVEMEVEV